MARAGVGSFKRRMLERFKGGEAADRIESAELIMTIDGRRARVTIEFLDTLTGE